MEALDGFLDYSQEWCDHKEIRLIDCRKIDNKYESGWITLTLEKDTLKSIRFEPKHRLEAKIRRAFSIADDKKGIRFDKPVSRKCLTRLVQWSMENGTSTHVHGYMWGGEDRYYHIAIKGDINFADVFDT